MLRSFADQDLDWWGLRVLGFSLLYDSLYRVAQQFADNVFEVAQDVWERRIQVTVDLDLGNLDMRTVSTPDQLLSSLATRLNDLFRVASQKDLSD